MQLNETLAFVAVVRAGSFTQAGKQLGVPKSTLSKQVTRLEQRLGARLLQRTTRKLSLTETGEAYFTRCRQAIEDIEEAERVAADVSGRVTGTLRVGTTESLASDMLVPRLPGFRERFPELRIEFVLSPHTQDMVAENIDVAVRGGPSLDEGVIARRLAGGTFHFYAAPGYLERRGAPSSLHDLEGHEVVGHPFMMNELPFEGPDGTEPFKLDPWLVADELSAVQAGVARGCGIGLVLGHMAEAWVKTGELVRVLNDYWLFGGHAWAVYPSKHHLSPKVRVFVDFLVELVESNGGTMPYVR